MTDYHLDTLEAVHKELSKHVGKDQAIWATGQACHESDWFRSQLAIKALNFWGIKATSSWSGKVYNSRTQEVINGNMHTINASFRAYSSITEGVVDYLRLVNRGYRDCLAQDRLSYFLAQLQGRWATDPNYAHALTDMIMQVHDYLEGHPKNVS